MLYLDGISFVSKNDLQISVMATERKDVSDSLVTFRFCHQIIKDYKVYLVYVQIFWIFDMVRYAVNKLDE